MLIGGIAFGLILGLLAGGSITNLASVRLRLVGLLMFAVILRFGTEYGLIQGSGIVEMFRLPLFALSFVILLVTLWANRGQPGMRLAFVGILSNTIAIAANAGHMPIWIRSLTAAGFERSALASPFHSILEADPGLDFFLHAGPLGDIIPIPLPYVRNVASIGDLFLTAGLAFFLFATVVRSQDDEPEYSGGPMTGIAGATRLPRAIESAIGQQRIRPGTGLASSLAETASLDRPLVLGATGTGLAGPSSRALLGRVRGADGRIVDVWTARPGGRPVALAPVPSAATAGTYDGAVAIPRPRVQVGQRVRSHPYVRLALNGPFTALWTGQMVSLLGDRIHQIALAALVVGLTQSVFAAALVFVAATLPNLLLSPIAGAFVDRWNHRDVMIVSDLLRAAVVLVMPIAAITNVWLVYPLIFLITTISIFFRPARVAILPRIVSEDDLLTANSALWAGETFADIVGYPLAGLFVAFLSSALPLAFWIDAATYGASAILIGSIAVPALQRTRASGVVGDERIDEAGEATSAKTRDGTLGEPDDLRDAGAATETGGIFREMREGFTFLRHEPVLFANTIQAAFAQFSIGALTALTYIFVEQVIAPRSGIEPTAGYAFLEASIGVGNLVGGFVIGLAGMRLAKGRLVIAGYVLFGLFLILFALSGNLGIGLGLLFGAGFANMAFVIPSQVLFQQRTPPELIGRVVSFRFALVFGSMTAAMAIGGILGQLVGVTPILALSGVASVLAGLAGLLVPALRDA